MLPIISADAIQSLIDKESTILIDARSGADAFDRFKKEHLRTAQHVDLDKDLSEKKDVANGGRHPLPSPAAFAALLGRLGITPSSHVLVYDDKSGANAASRFWWMLRAAGHKNVQVIDGGYQAAIRAGIALSTGSEERQPVKDYPFSDWENSIASIDDVKRAVADPDHLVIDAREAYRYRGESEPLDKVAGHIPGAMNIAYTGNLAEDGKFLPTEELKLKYLNALANTTPDKVIVHCGSGVTACHNLLALEQAGLKGALLYVGSWSEWSSNDLPVATGDES